MARQIARPAGVDGARSIVAGFEKYTEKFREINKRAPRRFEDRDWLGLQADAVERLQLYPDTVSGVVSQIGEALGDSLREVDLWAEMKEYYSTEISARPDRELAETFHNSVTRRIFDTVGVDPAIEFIQTEDEAVAAPTSELTIRFAEPTSRLAVHGLLLAFAHDTPYARLEEDVGFIAERINAELGETPARIEMVNAVFYRGQAAYLIGLIEGAERRIPLAIALRNSSAGVLADAVLLTENEVSILFSFTRSYFHVDVDVPHVLVEFLERLMPRKRVAELYISIGQNKHGKTELYRDLLRHVDTSNERFEHAPGTKGMVMIVFTMPGYDEVFKVIRDRFPLPKRTTRAAIIRKYQLVFQHDRAGRLMDVQDFQQLEFDRDRFDPALLEELIADASKSVTIEDGSVVLHHVFVERRIIPLDLFVREADAKATEQAVIDYGQAIKDLASTNIFPGDLLVKNFGVTRHGRVVFYDYDELSPLTEVSFKAVPEPRDDYDALSDQPWYGVGDRDVFPAEHRQFLGMTPHLRAVFAEKHGDLFEVEPWRRIQQRIEAGELIEVFPYTEDARLPGASQFRGW